MNMTFMVNKDHYYITHTSQQEAQLSQRNSASAAHLYLGWLTLTVHCTEHCRIADVVQLDYWQIVSTVSAKKASDIRGQ